MVCTFGVVGCGLTVIVSATVKVVRDIFSKDEPEGLATTVLPKDYQPQLWTKTVTRRVTSTSPRQRKRHVMECDQCSADISAEQVIRSDTVDDHTYLVRVCPSCKAECSTEAK